MHNFPASGTSGFHEQPDTAHPRFRPSIYVIPIIIPIVCSSKVWRGYAPTRSARRRREVRRDAGFAPSVSIPQDPLDPIVG